MERAVSAAWAGEHRFGHRDLFQLIRDGALSTGSFSSMLAWIFGSDGRGP
jgi:hypothetical protein